MIRPVFLEQITLLLFCSQKTSNLREPICCFHHKKRAIRFNDQWQKFFWSVFCMILFLVIFQFWKKIKMFFHAFLQWLPRYRKFSFFLIFNSVDLKKTFLRRKPLVPGTRIFLKKNFYNRLRYMLKKHFRLLTVRHQCTPFLPKIRLFGTYTDLKGVL